MGGLFVVAVAVAGVVRLWTGVGVYRWRMAGGGVSEGFEDGRASLVEGCLMALVLLCVGYLEDRCGIDPIDQR